MSMSFKSGASNVTIKNLTIKNFGQADGQMKSMVNQTSINWAQGVGWTIANNTISHNGGAGVWGTDNTKIINNCLEYNEQTGLAIPSIGGSNYNQRVNSLIEGNEIKNSNPSNNIENVGVCTGCAGGLKIWNTKGVIIRNNNVHDNNGNGIWVDNNNIDVTIEHNVSKNNSKRGIFYEISYSGIIRNNYVTGNYVSGKGGPNNPAIYISESGGDLATSNYLGSDQTKFPAELDVNNNYIVDNWQGISLWESAKRYCTKNDTSWCTPIIQGKNDTEKNANLTKCSTDLANNADVCRWKTQNVKIHNNKFEMTSAASTWCAPTNTGCANIAIFASADAPAGTPYAGTTVQTNISKNQNNKFYNNTYIGTWNFYIPNATVSRTTWQSTWGQDSGSQFNTSSSTSCTALDAGSSSVTLPINLDGGTYKVWVRIKNGTGAGKTRMILDNSICSDIKPNSQDTNWQWVSGDSLFSSISSGAHTFKLNALDQGQFVDKVIMLDGSSSCIPTDLGDNCTTIPNKPPVVSVSAPVSGAAATAPASFTINANASDSDGSVAKVEFYQGNTKLGEDTTAPYSFTWSNIAAGTYNLSAQATDNKGLTASSSAVSVVVKTAPVVVSQFINLKPENDTYTSSSQPNTNYGASPTLYATATTNYAYLRFHTTGVQPAGKSLVSAKLRLYTNYNAVTTGGFEVRKSTVAWNADLLTWSNQGSSFGTQVLTVSTVPKTNQWIEIALPISAITNDTNNKFGIRYTVSGSGANIGSVESSNKPELVLEYR